MDSSERPQTLADRLDEWAEGLEHLHGIGMGNGSHDLRAAAAALREAETQREVAKTLSRQNMALSEIIDALETGMADVMRDLYPHPDRAVTTLHALMHGPRPERSSE